MARNKKKDLFDTLSHEERGELMRDAFVTMFGPALGAEMWSRMEPCHNYRKRQYGDAAIPESNFWEGAWQIHSAE